MLENVNDTRSVTWLHGAQNGNLHAYQDRLRYQASVRQGKLQRRVWYSNPTSEDGEPACLSLSSNDYNTAKYHYKGRMDLLALEGSGDAVVLNLSHSAANYFLCGPEAFMEAQADALVALGVDCTRIHSEGF